MKYSQRALMVLTLLGLLSAIMSVLSVILISQLQPLVKESPPAAFFLPAEVWLVLLSVSTVLAALSLTLHLSCVTACLLHAYLSTEVCRGEQDRADWFLLDSRTVRHVAVGLFCLGVSVYLAAMSIFMLLIFEVETGIASACVLASGILVLLVVVIHSLVKASSTKHNTNEHLNTLYQNSHGGCNIPLPRPHELKVGVDQPRIPRSQSRLQHQLSYPPCGSPLDRDNHLRLQYSASVRSQDLASDKDGYSSGGSGPRMHRTPSTDSGLLQATPWNGVNNEMRSVLARKSGISTKDSTLV